ncbi:hypothetical protein MCETALH18_00736 [Methylophilaceae bacterium]
MNRKIAIFYDIHWFSSFPCKRESIFNQSLRWIPAFARMTDW